MQERIASGKQSPRASFDFANPNQVATDVLANPARANTDPDLWQWAIDYREQNPIKTPYAQASQVVQPQQAQPQQQEEKELTLAERMKKYREAAGENKGIGALQNRLSEREARLAKEEDRAPWLALMQAGLATMAGTSPNAMANIARGLMSGSQAYTNSMNKLEDAKDKSFDIQAKLEDAQRAEELAAAKYGLESTQADKKAKQTAQLEREKMANDVRIHEMTNAANLERERMQVGASKYAVDARNAAYGGRGAGSTFKTGVELRGLANAAQKRLDAHIKSLGFKAKQPSYLATDETYNKLLADRDEAVAAHKQYIAENSNYLGGQGTVTPPPAGGVSSGGDGWGQVQVK
jgi:hypothetical protein